MSLDRRLSELLHRRAGELGVADRALVACARYGSAAAVLVMLWVGARRGAAGGRALVRCLWSVAAIYAACELIGRLVPRSRPFAASPSANALIDHPPDRSFPSRHVASATAMALSVRPASATGSALLAFIALGVGVGRVRSGLHYPSDVMAGVALGWMVGQAVGTGRR